MGRELAEQYPAARAVFQEADDVLGFALSRLAWEGPEDELTRTLNAQPAILVHSIAVYRVISDRLPAVKCAAGHSLGELSAYTAAGTFTLADAVRTVRLRGELMYRGGQERPGTMAAILGLDDAIAERVCAEASQGDAVCVPANYNSPGQMVISGDTAAVQKAIELAKDAGAKRAMLLNVSGAFHSPLMQVATTGLGQQLNSIEMKNPAFPIVSNVTTQPVSEASEAKRLLVEQLTSPVCWSASMKNIVAAGVHRSLELGPGNVLCGLFKRIDKQMICGPIGSPADIESWAKA
jgi:[acyl-carrier-protein] S-malonyltransferase